MTNAENGQRSVASQLLARGIRVIEAMAATDKPIGVGELARGVGLPKSTVQRILHTLEEVGWAECVNEPVTRWKLTAQMSRLAGTVPHHRDLRSAALPHMRALSDATHEAIHLSLIDRQHWSTVLIERIDSTLPVRTHNELGTVVPLHVGAAGTAILAALDDEDVDKVLNHGLPAVTSGTVTTPNALRQKLEQIRINGYSVSRGEWREGIYAVAAVITNPDAAPLGAISISMPEARFTDDRVEEWGRMVVGARQDTQRDWWR